MKGKTKNKSKVLKIILLAMSFVLVAVITFNVTLAWFYDSDWASKSVTMAGSVGIELRDSETGPIDGGTGAGQLHFKINTAKAYPGQAVEVKAGVYNDGGDSGEGGSACYVRAHFDVTTDISEENLATEALYGFLEELITKQNGKVSTYKWVYYQNEHSHMQLDNEYWFEGTSSETQTNDQLDDGYFYLCYSGTDNKQLLPLNRGELTPFLWNDTFTIPWQLTNASADKVLHVALVFQAIQTFIPVIENGQIVATLDGNQLPADLCLYDNESVQTVFNSCQFPKVEMAEDNSGYIQVTL